MIMLSNYTAWAASLEIAQRQAFVGTLIIAAFYLLEVLLKRRIQRRKERDE